MDRSYWRGLYRRRRLQALHNEPCGLVKQFRRTVVSGSHGRATGRSTGRYRTLQMLDPIARIRGAGGRPKYLNFFALAGILVGKLHDL
jgi:hypothetical protein